MLKITLHDHPNQLRFRLEGKLAGAWVAELRQCWQTATSTTQGRVIAIDLCEVDFVDAEGQTLLADMVRQGVHLKAVTPFMRALVAEIEHAARYATVEESPSRSADVLVSSDPSKRSSGAL